MNKVIVIARASPKTLLRDALAPHSYLRPAPSARPNSLRKVSKPTVFTVGAAAVLRSPIRLAAAQAGPVAASQAYAMADTLKKHNMVIGML